jgi:phosphatidate phosphatase PAH1
MAKIWAWVPLAGCTGMGPGAWHTVPAPVGPTPSPSDPASDPAEGAEESGCSRVTGATRAAVVTDIDETLTTSDREWYTQLVIPTHDPEMRPDGDEVMWTYVSKGYRVIYVTARGEALRLLDGRSGREATEDWLAEHDFPFTSDGVFLAGGLGAVSDGAATSYKTQVLEDLIAHGFEIHFAYGNADSDIAAYEAAGIPPQDTFLVGELAGTLGVTGIPTPEAYTDHLAAFVDGVPCGS